MGYWDTAAGEIIMLMGCVATGFIISFLVWMKFFYENPNKYRKISRWAGLKRKSDDQHFKEMTQKLLKEGSFGIAEGQFKILLGIRPEDFEVHLGLAESLFGQVEWGLRKDSDKKGDALKEYQWVMRYYLQHEQLNEAVDLYKKILGPYSSQEIGGELKSLIENAAEKMGTIVVHDGDDFIVHLQKLHDEFDFYEKAGKYLQAESVVEDILKHEVIHDIDPDLLVRMGEVCLRNKKDRLVEDIFEQVVKRGDMLQTIRALAVLERFWMYSTRRPRLAQLYKESEGRFATIDESHEWLELGKRLRT